MAFELERNGCNIEGSEAEIVIPVELKTQGRRKPYAVKMSCVYAASETRSIDAIVKVLFDDARFNH